MRIARRDHRRATHCDRTDALLPAARRFAPAAGAGSAAAAGRTAGLAGALARAARARRALAGRALANIALSGCALASARAGSHAFARRARAADRRRRAASHGGVGRGAAADRHAGPPLLDDDGARRLTVAHVALLFPDDRRRGLAVHVPPDLLALDEDRVIADGGAHADRG